MTLFHRIDREPPTPSCARQRSRAASFASRCASTILVSMLLAGAPPTAVAQGSTAVAATLTVAQQRDMLRDIDAVGRRGFLYEVSRPPVAGQGPARKLYLYGTIHLGRVGTEPFNRPVLAALHGSRRLALEADPADGEGTRTVATRLGRYDDGDGLEQHVPPALLARVRAFGERIGLPGDRISRFKPWLLANMVAMSSLGDAGLDPAMGSELYLSGYARSARMPIVEIEGVEAQLRMLASLPDAMQAAQLAEALDEVDQDESRRQTQALFDLWLAGDRALGDAEIAGLHRDAEGKTFERFFIESLIDGRNRTMADKGEACLRMPGNTFFAIGSLHLFGETGLIREFERRGYRVIDLQASADR